MRQLHLFTFLILLQALFVVANVEKILFLGPSCLKLPTKQPILADLELHTLSPYHATIRTQLRAEFPKNSSKWGEISWILLHGLSEGQRYELRICWAATVILYSIQY